MEYGTRLTKKQFYENKDSFGKNLKNLGIKKNATIIMDKIENFLK